MTWNIPLLTWPSFAISKGLKKYFLLGSFIFVIGLVWHFPFNRLQSTIIAKAEQRIGVKIEVDSLTLALPLGIKAKNLALRHIPIGQELMRVDLNMLKLTVSPWSALRLAWRNSGTIQFALERKAGSARGSVSLKKEDIRIQAKGKEIDLDIDIPMSDPLNASGTLNLKLVALLAFSTDITSRTAAIIRGDLSTLSGDIELRTTKTQIQAPVINQLSFDRTSVLCSSKDGKVTIKSLALEGPALSVKASGNLEVSTPLEQSTLRLDSQISLRDQGSHLKTLLSLAGINLDADGNAAIKLRGPLMMPQLSGY